MSGWRCVLKCPCSFLCTCVPSRWNSSDTYIQQRPLGKCMSFNKTSYQVKKKKTKKTLENRLTLQIIDYVCQCLRFIVWQIILKNTGKCLPLEKAPEGLCRCWAKALEEEILYPYEPRKMIFLCLQDYVEEFLRLKWEYKLLRRLKLPFL